jgi:hypothetical protein
LYVGRSVEFACTQRPPAMFNTQLHQQGCTKAMRRSLVRLSSSLKIAPCETISFSDQISWKDVIANQQPLVIRNLGHNWPAIHDPQRKWESFQYLIKKSGQSLVPVEVGGDYMNQNTIFQKVKFAEVLHKLHTMKRHQMSVEQSTPHPHPHYYLAQHHLLSMNNLIDDVVVPDICSIHSNSIPQSPNLWLGSSSSSSPCHHDPYENILIQIFGKKTITLFSPDQTPYLYRAPLPQRNTSQVNFNSLNEREFDKFPLLRMVSGYQANLSPGDGVYIPIHWWHFCQAQSLNCSVNFWWSESKQTQTIKSEISSETVSEPSN